MTTENRRLVATLACRNQGTRLYGKPMQFLDIEKRLSILEYMINEIHTIPEVDEIVLGISEGEDNLAFQTFANKKGVKFIVGSEEDVLQRLIDCCKAGRGTDLFRVTTESPFIYFEGVAAAWSEHIKSGNDITALDHLPDGVGFELISLAAYEESHEKGQKKHRSELCSLYIREHKAEFKFGTFEIPVWLKRTDIRLTVDYPEDLVLCRAVYQRFKELAPRIPLKDIIDFLDRNPPLKALVEPFREEGLKTMYV